MLRNFCTPLLFACCTLLSAEAGPEMTTKVFKLPFNFIGAAGPASSKPAPADPFAVAPLREPLLSEEPEFKSSRKILEEAGVEFPPGASALFDPVTQELTVHNTADAHDLTEAFIDSMPWEGSTPTLAFTLTLVQGPGEVIREANAAASSHVDATPQLDALLAEAAKPGASVQVVGEMFLETKSGVRATTEAVLERPVMEGFRSTTEAIKAEAAPAPTPPTPKPSADDEPLELRPSWIRQDGMKLELEALFDRDDKKLAGTVSLHLGPEPPELDSAGGRRPAPGLRRASFQAAISMPNGGTRLIGITKPTGREKAEGKDILQAAFLTGSVRRMKSPPGVLAVTDAPQKKLTPGMRAVAFEMPAGLAETFLPKELLTGQHALPKGMSLHYRDGRLEVVNTPEFIEGMAALVDHAWGKAPHNVAITMHAFLVPATLLRPLVRRGTAAENADDSAMLAAVEAAAARHKAWLISSTFFEGKSGVRTRREAGLVHSLLTRFDTTPGPTDRELHFMQQIVGEALEIEPTVSANGRMVDLAYHHETHPSLPASQRERLRVIGAAKDHDVPGVELQVQRTDTSVSMASGTTKLISLHLASRRDDKGGPEMLQATFLQAHVVPQARQPKPRPLTQAEAAKARIMEKMDKIILPEVVLEGASREKAIDYLRIKSREADTSTNVESEKGVNIILRMDDVADNASITLDLKDVPLSEALRYVTELAIMRYKVEENSVLVTPFYCEQASPLHTRIFRVPPDFLSIPDDNPGPIPVDPFAPAPDPNTQAAPRPPKTARRILEAQGITFPEGSSAKFTASTGTLVVRNTQPNLDLCEAFTSCSLGKGTRASMALTAQVLQGPGPLLRRMVAQAAPLNDHRAMLDELLAAVKTGTVQALDTARIETRSGNRITTQQGHDGAALSGLALDVRGGSLPWHDPLFSGLRLKLEPTLGVDGICVGLTLASEFHTAPPLPRQEHLVDDQSRRIDFALTDSNRARLTTDLNILDGHTQLVHLWRPTGSTEFIMEDVLQVLFITCEVLREPKE